MSNIDTVKTMYEAFGRGDVPAILAHLDDNVEWDTQYEKAAAPWLEPRRGKANVPGFFEAVSTMGITKFEPFFFAEDGNMVVSVIHIEAEIKGKKYTIPNEGHLWTFGPDGKVTSYQHLVDTSVHWQMAQAL
jgi:ketosteroid isomerase-like protein